MHSLNKICANCSADVTSDVLGILYELKMPMQE
jgi:hypothetical protein